MLITAQMLHTLVIAHFSRRSRDCSDEQRDLIQKLIRDGKHEAGQIDSLRFDFIKTKNKT